MIKLSILFMILTIGVISCDNNPLVNHEHPHSHEHSHDLVEHSHSLEGVIADNVSNIRFLNDIDNLEKERIIGNMSKLFIDGKNGKVDRHIGKDFIFLAKLAKTLEKDKNILLTYYALNNFDVIEFRVHISEKVKESNLFLLEQHYIIRMRINKIEAVERDGDRTNVIITGVIS